MKTIRWKYSAPEVEITCTYQREVDGTVTVDCNIEPPYIMLVDITYEEYLIRHVIAKPKSSYLIDPDKAAQEAIDKGELEYDANSIAMFKDAIPRVIRGFSYTANPFKYAYKYVPTLSPVSEMTPEVEKMILEEMQEVIQMYINPSYLVDMSKAETSTLLKIAQARQKAYDEGLFMVYDFYVHVKNVKMEDANNFEFINDNP